MPLAQHTLPVFNTKSYIEWPQWKYKRVPGFGKVKLNDIVVFNFPAGDTVAVNYQQTTDFYTLAYGEGQRIYSKQIEMDSLTRAQQRAIYDLYYAAGRKQIMNNPRTYGEVLWRPVDRRENYVKRCVGLPGDTLQIVDGQVMIDGKAIENPENLQFNYFVQTTGPYIPEDMLRELGISKDDTMLIEDSGWESGLLEMGLDSRNAQGKLNPVYHFPLTKKMYETLLGNKKLISKIVMEPEDYAGQMYPLNLYTKWNRNKNTGCLSNIVLVAQRSFQHKRTRIIHHSGSVQRSVNQYLINPPPGNIITDRYFRVNNQSIFACRSTIVYRMRRHDK